MYFGKFRTLLSLGVIVLLTNILGNRVSAQPGQSFVGASNTAIGNSIQTTSVPPATVPSELPPTNLDVAVPGGAPQVPGQAAVTPPGGCPEGTPASTAFDFSKTPNQAPFPRTGMFQMQPTGPGYYTLIDQLQGAYSDKAPKYGYTRNGIMPQPFYAVDFRYLDDPANEDHVITDSLKRIKVGDNWMFSTGGQAWSRYMDILNQGLGPKRSVEDLMRARSYGDLWYKDQFRVFVEFMYADSLWQDVPPGPNDINRGDFQNLFIDWKMFELDGRPAYARVGRQELAFGSQRLISTIDFINSRRTFQGVRGTYAGEKWDFDMFWVQPVIVNPTQLDSVDDKQNFVGAWSTYHPNKNQLVDLYYLYLDNHNAVSQLGILRDPSRIHTIGSRYTGDANNFLWDFEGAIQLGSVGSQNLVAGMFTGGAGYHFKDVAMNPTLWLYYDYASGDHSPNKGTDTTFNQLFGFGHLYLGGLDVIGRQNIHDLNLHLYLYPTNWITCWAQVHELWLDSRTDALYNIGGIAIRRDPTGRAGNYVGNELNFVTNFHLTANQDLQVGYGRLFGGTFLQKTGSSTMDYTYVQYSIRW